MLEWIGRDPLNGVIITITFFSSTIIGRYIRKKKAKLEHSGKFIDPRIKLFVLFVLIISITLMKHWFVPLGISILCLLISLKLKKFQNYSRKLVFPTFLAFFIILIQGLTYGNNKINFGIIPLYSEGLEYGYLIFARVLAAASLIILLTASVTENEILETMRWYRVPGTILDISSLMSRYIKAFSTEGRKMKMAHESRCGFSGRSGFREKMHDVASISGALIVRAFIRAEQVYRAMLSRGWKQNTGSMAQHKPFKLIDMFMAIFFSGGIIILLLIDRML